MARGSGTVWALRSLGYHGSVCLKRCGCEELPCPLLTWLVSEHRTVCQESQGSDGQGPRVGAVLVEELKAVLAKLDCPYPAISSETLCPALLNKLVEFLVSELQAARILQYKACHPEDTERGNDTEKEQREWWDGGEDTGEEQGEGNGTVERGEEIQRELTQLFKILDLDMSSHLADLCILVESRLLSLPEGALPGPLLKSSLSSEQWRRVEQIHMALTQDYECRRHMMIKRFYVTLKSFTWGEKGEERSLALSSMTALPPLSLGSSVSLSLLLAAREDQSRILPVKAGPSTAVHKMLMGSVPDRGGRPGEIEPPMPDWERRREGGGGGRGGRGGGRQQRKGNPKWKKKGKTE